LFIGEEITKGIRQEDELSSSMLDETAKPFGDDNTKEEF